MFKVNALDFNKDLTRTFCLDSGAEALICPASELVQLTRDKRSELKSSFVLEPIKVFLVSFSLNFNNYFMELDICSVNLNLKFYCRVPLDKSLHVYYYFSIN
jgi:hypothetical protein